MLRIEEERFASRKESAVATAYCVLVSIRGDTLRSLTPDQRVTHLRGERGSMLAVFLKEETRDTWNGRSHQRVR